MRRKYPLYKLIFEDSLISILMPIGNNYFRVKCYFFQSGKKLYSDINKAINVAIEIQKDNWDFKQGDRISSIMRLTALKGKYDIKNSGKTISK